MKSHNSRQPLDEREKLRKFRELDDAFADALRELEHPDNPSPTPAAPFVHAAEQQEKESQSEPQAVPTRQGNFKQRLEALMADYDQPAENVRCLLQTLSDLGRSA